MVKKEKMQEKNDQVIESISETPKVIEEPTKIEYFKCSFCGEEETVPNNRMDPSSSWCKKCGKCYEVKWLIK